MDKTDVGVYAIIAVLILFMAFTAIDVVLIISNMRA